MMPHPQVDLSLLERRRFLRLLLTTGCGMGGLAALSGCTGPLVRSQSPDPESYLEEEIEQRVKLVGDLTGTWGLNHLKVESVALVNGLAGTGSDPPPSPQRQTLLDEMKSHEVDKPHHVLASADTAMVICRGYLPPGCQKGDRFDIEVRIAPRTDTSSLRGGWMMQTRMRETEFLGSSIKTGHVVALAQGPVIVEAIFNQSGDPVLETRGRIQGGGVVTKDRLMGLVVKTDYKTVRVSSMIGAAINSRFFWHDRGIKVGLAKPKEDDYIELRVHPRYKNNLARYIRVVRSIAVNESLTDRANRLLLLGKMIFDPVSAATAALQLEAIGGKDGIPVLRKALASDDPEVRFYTAEALAYLDDAECTTALRDAAQHEPAFRWHAITALSSMDHLSAFEALNELLHVQSAETRYGAFRALRARNADDPLLRGEAFHHEYTLHVIPSAAEPMVHFTQWSRPEVVLFSDQIRILPRDYLTAGKQIIVKRAGEDELRVSRFAPGKEDEVVVCTTRLDDALRTVGRLGGRYEDLLQLVHEAKRQDQLTARVVIDAVPQANRLQERQGDEASAAEATRRRVASPMPDLFAARPKMAEYEEEDNAAVAAAERAEQEAAAAEEASKKKGIWSKMMWWKD